MQEGRGGPPTTSRHTPGDPGVTERVDGGQGRRSTPTWSSRGESATRRPRRGAGTTGGTAALGHTCAPAERRSATSGGSRHAPDNGARPAGGDTRPTVDPALGAGLPRSERGEGAGPRYDRPLHRPRVGVVQCPTTRASHQTAARLYVAHATATRADVPRRPAARPRPPARRAGSAAGRPPQPWSAGAAPARPRAVRRPRGRGPAR